MKFLVAFLFLIAAVFAKIEVDEGVLVLTDANFDEAIKANPAMLVEFYAPWCGHCKSLAPEYAKAAKKLAKDTPSVKLAKVDATENNNLASQYEIKGFPTLKWFKNGKATEYNGGRTEAEIVNWVNKKSGPAAKTLNTEEDMATMQDNNEAFVIGVFASESSPAAKVFLDHAAEDDSTAYAITTSDAVKSKLALTEDTIVVIKSFDDLRADLRVTDSFDAGALGAFVAGESVPLIQEFSQENSRKIFKSPITKHALVFTKTDADHHAPTLAAMQTVASAFKGKTLFINVPSTENRVLEFFDLKESDLPTLILGDVGGDGGQMKKYPYSGEITSEGVTTFLNNFFDGKLKPHLKSEKVVPEDTTGGVVVVKGASFNDIVLNNDKDVLVEFYAPWCGHCKKLAPTWDELGAKFKGNDNIVIAKMDATANEVDVPGLSIRGFPSIFFFKGNDKSNPIKYDEGRELDDLVSFLKKNSHNPAHHDEL